MRKIIILTLCFLAIMSSLNAQNLLNVKFSKATADPGDTARVDVTVENFDQLIGAQFSVAWDSTKFKYGAISDIVSKSVLSGDLDIGTPPTVTIKQGTITVAWYSASPVSVANNTKLFTLKLKAFGAPCDSVKVDMANLPLKPEYYDANFMVFKPNSTAGQAKIKGPNCTGGGGGGGTGTELVVKAPILTALPNSEVCIPITVTNFINIEGAQSIIKWDPAVLKIKPLPPLKYDALPNNLYNTSQIANGEFNFIWLTSGAAINIPNGERLMEICFDVVGPVGSMTTIDLVDKNAITETEYVDNTGKSVPYINMDGKVTIVDKPLETLKISVGDVNASTGQEINVPFNVDNFKEIKGAQFAIIFDPNVLEFIDRNTSNPIFPENIGNFISPNRYNISFTASGTSNATIPNGSLMFNLKFRVKTPCVPGISPITINDLPGYVIEFVNKDVVKVPYQVKQGSVNITCGTTDPVECNIVSSKNVSCNGAGDASITVTVSNANGCDCIWKKDGIAFGNPIPAPNCNLSNIGPGTYVLEVSCNGSSCSKSVTITEPAPLTINETITNVGCGVLGSIVLNVTGGTDYEYKWNVGNATTKDISNLPVGSYSVTVTEKNTKCTASKSFNIIDNGSPNLIVQAQVTDVKCNGEKNGAIKLTISGGCDPYKIEWSDNAAMDSETRTGLASGTYGVTVTDKSNPAKVVSQQIIVGQPDLIVLTGVTTESSGNNGAVNLTVAGGTEPYTYAWSFGGIKTEDINGLPVGQISVVVTDKNFCTSSKIFEITGPINTENPVIGNLSVISENKNAGFGVSCANLCDGEIQGGASKGTAPYTVVLSGAATKTITLASAGNFNFTGLCVGTYTVKVTDAKGNSTTSPSLNVTTPTIIKVTSDIDCADGVLPIGKIEITVTGGAGAYKYNWSNGKTTEDIENLQKGTFTVVVSDANGCQQTLSNQIVKDCNDNNEDCFSDFTNIITPNSDGLNDFFLVSCAPDFDNELFVYDRYGKLVYSQKNYNNLWDGTSIGGEPLPENGYMWLMNVTYNDGSKESFKGAVTILRN